jgi:hypothetical protein
MRRLDLEGVADGFRRYLVYSAVMLACPAGVEILLLSVQGLDIRSASDAGATVQNSRNDGIAFGSPSHQSGNGWLPLVPRRRLAGTCTTTKWRSSRVSVKAGQANCGIARSYGLRLKALLQCVARPKVDDHSL